MIQELRPAAQMLSMERWRIMDSYGWAYALYVRVTVGSFYKKVNIKTLLLCILT